MSGNLQSLAKWLPAVVADYDDTFTSCRVLKNDCLVLIREVSEVSLGTLNVHRSDVANLGNVSEDLLPVEEMEKISAKLENLTEKFEKCFKLLKPGNVTSCIYMKLKMYRNLLWKVKLQLCYILQEFICDIASLFVYHGDFLMKLTLRMSTSYNSLLSMDSKFNLSKNTNSVCNNTCPYLFFPLRKFSVTRLLQILSANRAEYCCHRLIDCLFDTCKMHDNTEEDNNSDNSSFEIYVALTKHLSPPLVENEVEMNKKENSINIDDSIESFVHLEELIASEQANVLNILNLTQQIAPAMLGKEGVKRNKSEYKLSGKIIQKVLEYYEQILWAEVGNYMEHVVLWWTCHPLSARSPRSSQHLREWINHFVPTAEIPTVILSALTSLADALGVHVTSTLWDYCFRKALVASKTTCNPETGQLFCNVLQELVTLCNLCEVTANWISGAPLDELPVVEQIPVLHRLDHSIHTTRLWTISECRKNSNNWNVEAFFKISHTDIVNCLVQLHNLRLIDHTVEIEKGGMAVHVEVCALMRAKLVSEVQENIHKLKDAPSECLETLASICKITNLANLKMIFPPKVFWKASDNVVPNAACSYVNTYLERTLTPVLKAVDNDTICNTILTLICESWLDHIYNNKIKFSQHGACQLLCDFAYVSLWIEECPIIHDHMRKKLLRNEVLRRCEGVGRLLLRCPGEKLKMVDKKMIKKTAKEKESDEETDTQQMPAEMYVPNQEQWLELRALKKTSGFNPFCC
ncbi:uncharacterized protein LOC115888556 [Sitophilus oryzae]|uniref:Uncharacterized protein LOC115888556 n=1 Tax=Sitophilus oryzae TaxID=7048 RepID=A0A6J2YJF9_SITOR|nr:uncharacterized protein LOC115888556 [Sitophilus oryzae]